MLSKPTVSIIIPVYNVMAHIAGCLESCINQTFHNIEIIVVNDGSTDGSELIIEEYRKRDIRIKVIHKQNEGLPFARKTGIQVSQGEFVFHLDGDDSIPEKAIENLLSKNTNDDIDIVVGDVDIYKGDIFLKQRIYSDFKIGSGIEFLEFILSNQLYFLWGKIIKRKLYTTNEIEINKEASLGEDQIQMFQLCMFALKVTSTNSIVYRYQLNDSSITQRRIDNKQYVRFCEAYSHTLYGLLYRFQYNKLIHQQINLRILIALYEALTKSGHFILDRRKSRMIFFKTLIDSVFSRKKILFNHLLITIFARPIYHKIKQKLRRN